MSLVSNLPSAPTEVDDAEGVVINAPNAPDPSPNPESITHKVRLRTITTILAKAFTYLTTTRLSDLSNALLPDLGPKVLATVDGEAITPVWGAASAAPAVGNGTLVGRVTQIGQMQRVSIALTIGSTSTMGSGAWHFTLPAPYAGNAVATAVGSVVGRDGTGSLWRVGSCRVLVASNQIQLFSNGIADGWASGVPHTWADGDTLTLSIEYEVSAA